MTVTRLEGTAWYGYRSSSQQPELFRLFTSRSVLNKSFFRVTRPGIRGMPAGTVSGLCRNCRDISHGGIGFFSSGGSFSRAVFSWLHPGVNLAGADLQKRCGRLPISSGCGWCLPAGCRHCCGLSQDAGSAAPDWDGLFQVPVGVIDITDDIPYLISTVSPFQRFHCQLIQSLGLQIGDGFARFQFWFVK